MAVNGASQFQRYACHRMPVGPISELVRKSSRHWPNGSCSGTKDHLVVNGVRSSRNGDLLVSYLAQAALSAALISIFRTKAMDASYHIGALLFLPGSSFIGPGYY